MPEDVKKGIHLTKDVPLTWVIGSITTLIAALGGLALSQYTEQVETTERVNQAAKNIEILIDSNKELSRKITLLAIQLNNKDLKVMEHDARLNDLARRVADNEHVLRGTRFFP